MVSFLLQEKNPNNIQDYHLIMMNLRRFHFNKMDNQII